MKKRWLVLFIGAAVQCAGGTPAHGPSFACHKVP